MQALLSIALLAIVQQGNSPQYVSAPWSETPSKIVAGWTEYSTSGIKVSFPPGWAAIHRRAEDVKTKSAALSPEIANSAFFKASAKSYNASKEKFFIYDTDSDSTKFRRNAVLGVSKVEVGMADLLKVGKKAYESAKCPTKIWYVDLPVGRSGLLETQFKRADGGVVTSYSYVVDHNGSRYLFSFAEALDDAQGMEQLSLQVMKTFRFAK